MSLRPVSCALLTLAFAVALPSGLALAEDAPKAAEGTAPMKAEGASKIAPADASKIASALMATAPSERPAADLKVGALAPGQLELRPLPTSVTDIVPEYRGFPYAVSRDRVAIVQPKTRRIVEVIGPAP